MAEFYSATIRKVDRFRGPVLLRDLQRDCRRTGSANLIDIDAETFEELRHFSLQAAALRYDQRFRQRARRDREAFFAP